MNEPRPKPLSYHVVLVTDTGQEVPHYSVTTRQEARKVKRDMQQGGARCGIKIKRDVTKECYTCLGAKTILDGETLESRKCLDCNGEGSIFSQEVVS
jgi:hypothetical protein